MSESTCAHCYKNLRDCDCAAGKAEWKALMDRINIRTAHATLTRAGYTLPPLRKEHQR